MKIRHQGSKTQLGMERLESRRLLVVDTLELTLVSTGDPSDPTAMIGNDSSLRPAISADGRYIVFRSSADNWVPDDSNRLADVFVKDMRTGKLVFPSSGSSMIPRSALIRPFKYYQRFPSPASRPGC